MATQTVEAVDHKLLAAGEWIETGEWGEVESPYDGTVVGRVAAGRRGAGRPRAIEAAHEAFETADFPQHERAAVLDRAAELVGERVEDLALTIAAEAGKPMKTATVEAQRCVDTLTFSAVEARKLTGGTVPMEASPAGAGKLGVMLRVPYGVVGAISPFNFPLNLVAHKLGPAIAAGNAIVLKPAGQTPISALKLAEILVEAGLPEGWLSVVPGPGSRGRQRDRRARADRGAHLHRLGRGRLGHPQPRPAQEGQPRARLQRAADRQRRRRLGGGGRQSPDPRLLPRRPELHLDPADPRPRGRRRRLHRAARRQRREAEGRRPARPRDRRRPADHPRRPRPGQGVDRRGGRRRRRAADRRRAGRRGPLPRPDPARRRRRKTPRSGARRSSARSRRSTASPTSTRRCAMANDSKFGLQAGVFTRDIGRGLEAGEDARVRRRPDQRGADLPRRPDALRRRQGLRQHPRGPGLRGLELTEERFVTLQG